MKNNLSFQLSAGTNRNISEQDSFPVIDMVNSFSGYADKFIPVRTSFAPVAVVKKIYNKESGVNTVSNFPMKGVAAHLSEIEMALDCYNVSELQFSTRGLKQLLEDKKMPAICKLAARMEVLADENRFQDVKDLLREVKRIIGWIVKHRKQPMN